MRADFIRTTIIDRPSATTHKGHRDESATGQSTGQSMGANPVARREGLFSAIRLSRLVNEQELDRSGGVVVFNTSIVGADGVDDLQFDRRPGIWEPGEHHVTGRGIVAGLRISGTFTVVVDDGTCHAPIEATWSANDTVSGSPRTIPVELAEQLPQSFAVAELTGGALNGAVRRIHLAAERARHELIESNQGLTMTVVNRFRAVVRAESASLDMSDLVIVGKHQLLEVVDRHYTNPNVAPTRDVAWSKLVQRAIGNAVRSEIARSTGVSVEFRQLLTWFQTHPEDRDASPELVAQRMAFAAGVTRLLAKQGMSDRNAGVAMLELMLISGEAAYVAPGRHAATTARHLRHNGVFVVSPRSSLVEIERAQRFGASSNVRLDADDEGHHSGNLLATSDAGYDDADWLDAVQRIIRDSGLTKVEALVWLHRSGALDPGGYGTELPDIAEDLGLDGRGEARAALRRARRKLDAWAIPGSREALVS